MRRVLAALALLVLLVGAGCAEQGDQPPAGDVTAVPSEDRPGQPTGDETIDNSTPRDVPADQRFGLEDTATFNDQLEIEIAGTIAAKAEAKDKGADATNGQIVIASVRIFNGTPEEFTADDVLISATYGNGQDAQIIVDATDQLKDGFTGTIAPGDEMVIPIGFAVPTSGLAKVTYTVDCNDDIHDPVSFSGKVTKE